ncbi:hypothetical protein GCM10007862_25040 [Dyella lipolytica]|uniref:PKD domain-containing protein n=1 Tax=Dyella lipolytica TaxID=1867835 RepID=A0ABW8IRK2_9GAMM|nr:hypothetical protein [Dyella lipolytica]GLQ47453.1 hypothetical protein GCM10007862_25040 [Dyella lipolytica]
MKISRKPVIFAVSLAAALALGACGKKEEASAPPPAPAPAPAATQPAPTPAPAAPAAVSVTSVDLGSAVDADQKITTATTSFTPKDTIYASIATGGAGTAAFGVKWSYQDGQTVKEDTKTINPTGPANTEFHISKPSGWPTGNYKVDISLNGQSVASKDFSVK